MSTQTKELRELRLWHWRQACISERIENSVFAYGDIKTQASHNHSFHMKAVQALNDCFPLDDTAAQDHHLESQWDT